MLDNTFSIKEISKILECSTQNIYRQKDELLTKGFMIKNEETGAYFITTDGFNFLKEKRIETMKANNQNNSSVDNQELINNLNRFKSNETSMFSDNTEIITLLKEQIEDLKKDRDYWKTEYTKKDNELTNQNKYLQEINLKAFNLLGTAEQNKEQEKKENEKRGFFRNLFGK